MLGFWMWMLGCADTAALEARVAALEAQNAALENQVVTLELRVDDLEVFVYSETFGAPAAPSEGAAP